jgi:molybdopterin/thiamine biosynthesis adenylyltransferase
MKVLQIGVGGIGSYFVENLYESIEQGHITEPIELTIADDDMVEPKQIMWQNFTLEQIGMSKSEAITKKLNDYDTTNYDIKTTDRIIKTKQLEGFDLIVLCVDNDIARCLVAEYCHKKDVEFIDLRATGRKIFAVPKLKTKSENMKFIDKKDLKEYSCQDKADLEKGWIQIGNKIIATIGVQMVMNYTRGHNNHIFNSFI